MTRSLSYKQVRGISWFLTIGGCGVLLSMVAIAVLASETMARMPLVPYYIFVSLTSMLLGPFFLWMNEPRTS